MSIQVHRYSGFCLREFKLWGIFTFALCLFIVATPSCVSVPKTQLTPSDFPIFEPISFFSGRTEGRGTLKKLFSSSVPIIVRGDGSIDADGVFVLGQVILEGDKPPRKRTWRIQRVGDRTYAGSLSDADGPVNITITGNRMHITFKLKDGFLVDQYIFIAADGQSAQNVTIVSKLGIKVAILKEQIVRLGQ